MTSIGIPFDDPELEGRAHARLAEVEKELMRAVSSDHDLIADVSRHLLDAGGKRFRPLLVVLASEFGDPDSPGVVPAALVVELTHVATLYHDDVMDEAELRRGAPSANSRWSNSIAILTGDLLFAKASEIVAELGPDAVRIQAMTFARLVSGQLRETVGAADGADPVGHHLAVLADKTASLIATSARLGAMVSRADRAYEVALTDFGEEIGMAFQLSDDIIDITGERTELGKLPGTDLREGIATLPILVAQRSRRAEDARLLELLSGPLPEPDDHAEALALLRAHPAIDEARTEVVRRAARAREFLAGLPDLAARDALATLCDVVVSRTS
jgi:heptaprenyl diphosphate synthase